MKTNKKTKKILFLFLPLLGLAVFLFFPQIASADAGEMAAKFLGLTAGSFISLLGSLIATILQPLVMILVRIGAYVFDFALEMTSVFVSSDFINTPWKFLRDLANLAFIFILLLVAISKILGTWLNDDKIIVRLIIVALLINFSKVITLFVIDLSQMVTAFFIEQTLTGGATGVSSRIMNALQVTNVLDLAGALKDAVAGSNVQSLSAMTISSIMSVVVIVVVAYYFIVGAWMLLRRMIGLIIIVITSPIAFLAYILPDTVIVKSKKWFDMWLNHLFEYAFFAPVFMFGMFLAINFGENMQTFLREKTAFINNSGASLANGSLASKLLATTHLGQGVTGVAIEPLNLGGIGGVFFEGGTMFIVFILEIAILLLVLNFAQKSSIGGAKAAMNLTSNWGKKITGLSKLERGFGAYKEERKKAKEERAKTSLSSRLGARTAGRISAAGETVRSKIGTRAGKERAGQRLGSIKVRRYSQEYDNKTAEELETIIKGFEPANPQGEASARAAGAAKNYISEGYARDVSKDSPLLGLKSISGGASAVDIDDRKKAIAYMQGLIRAYESRSGSTVDINNKKKATHTQQEPYQLYG